MLAFGTALVVVYHYRESTGDAWLQCFVHLGVSEKVEKLIENTSAEQTTRYILSRDA